MKLQEFHARELLRDAGLPVPPGHVARTPAEVRRAAEELFAAGHARIVVKAQVTVGGRGKAGGVKLAASPEEAEAVGAAILGMTIKGIRVRKVLVVPGADIVRELYLGAILDRSAERILVMGSSEGGVEIEETARLRPAAIVRVHAHPHLGLLDFAARKLAFALGLGGPHLRQAVAIAQGLVSIMQQRDADLVEVNPLAIVREAGPDGSTTGTPGSGTPGSGTPVERLVCLDAKMTLDDSALMRHPDLAALRDLDEEDPADTEARAADINFIHLDGNIGCLVNGAGLAMATMDLVKRAGGEPANFLDIGGGAKADKVAAAMALILADPKVRAILVNIFGGITRGDEVARGLVEARAVQTRSVPMVVRIVGTNAAEAAAILRAAAFETAGSLEEAAAKAVALTHAAETDAAETRAAGARSAQGAADTPPTSDGPRGATTEGAR